jgi:hypothetical protein
MLNKLNLQYFSDENGQGDGGAEGSAENQQNGQENTENTGTQLSPEVQELLKKAEQSAADRVRTEYSKQLKSVTDQLEELKRDRLTDKERLELEQKQKEDEFERLKQENHEFKIGGLAIDLLKESGLPLEFKTFAMGSDEDATKVRVESLKTIFNDAVAKAVEERFKTGGRDITKGGQSLAITKEQFLKMGYSERVKIANENPELYKKLSS